MADGHYLLFYEAADDYMTRRPEFRARHLAHAWRAQARGELLLAGAVGDAPPKGEGVEGALLVFRGSSPEVAEAFARSDPYVVNGLVRAWRVRAWHTVVGEGAARPLAPEEV